MEASRILLSFIHLSTKSDLFGEHIALTVFQHLTIATQVFGSGPVGPHSVLDKCVPGYYLRRSEDGHVENSTCMLLGRWSLC